MKFELSNKIFFAEVERLISEGENVTITLKGHSMRPWLRSEKHKVVLRPYTIGEVKIGDIVLFRYKGGHILHRVVDIADENIAFAGDGNIKCYELATMSDIVAIAESVITPKGRVIECSSREWRIKSGLWLALPQSVRRVALGVIRRLID